MIIPKRVVGRVKHFIGLNLYETQIWLALLSHGVATAGELAEAAGVPGQHPRGHRGQSGNRHQ